MERFEENSLMWTKYDNTKTYKLNKAPKSEKETFWIILDICPFLFCVLNKYEAKIPIQKQRKWKICYLKKIH